uniref:Uncharacterized protein n=1 Tax=Vitis vinifera TaxID=29760 RepID=A5B203_VITVI|nr:hypothetical protein VITISV_043243 [Vitis vinifera]
MIRTTYPDRVCYHPGCDVHKFRVLLSWGIRMELIRIAMHTPYHQGEGSLHLARGDGPPCDAQHSSFHPGKNYVRPTIHLLRISHIRKFSSVRSYMSGSSDRIFHIQHLTPDGRAGRFNFPGQTYPDPLIALTRRVSAADNSESPDSLAHQTLVIRRIHFRPQ